MQDEGQETDTMTMSFHEAAQAFEVELGWPPPLEPGEYGSTDDTVRWEENQEGQMLCRKEQNLHLWAVSEPFRGQKCICGEVEWGVVSEAADAAHILMQLAEAWEEQAADLTRLAQRASMGAEQARVSAAKLSRAAFAGE